MIPLKREDVPGYVLSVRKKMGLSCRELAGRLYVTEATATDWEWGNSVKLPGTESFIRLANMAGDLDFTVDDIPRIFRMIRKAARLNQKAFASCLQISNGGLISSYEHGRIIPRLSIFLRVLKFADENGIKITKEATP